MSDSVIAFTVVLEREHNQEGAEAVAKTLAMVKGVQSVHPVVAGFETDVATERARWDLLLALGDFARNWRK